MRKRRVMAMLATAMLTFTSVAPQYVTAADGENVMVVEEVEEDSEDGAEGAVSENEAEEASVSEAAAEEVLSENEAVSENSAEEEAEPQMPSEGEALPEGVKGMPDGYTLSETELEIKANINSHDVLAELAAAQPGVDYVEDQVFCLADTEEYAQQIAEAYGIELVEFNYKVAIFDVSESSRDVYETVALGADMNYMLPALEANYLRQDVPVEGSDLGGYSNDAIRSFVAVNTPGEWGDIYKELANPDPLLAPDDANYQWWHDTMDSWAGWQLYGTDFSKSGITVAVMDSGVNATHEDLKGHVTQIAGVGGGATTPGGHGTHVAGIIGATAGNGKGGAGVAPGVQMIALCHTHPEDGITDAYVTACYRYIVDHPVNLVNMSFGGPIYTATEEALIEKAYKKNVTFLASTGNDRANCVKYPAQYDHVISVGATMQDDSKTTFSTFGKGIADVYAPGADMMSTYIGSNSAYEKEQGTSMSCPAAVGACAVYMSIVGAVDPDTMEKVLTENVLKCNSKDAGAGIANVAKMLGGDTTAPEMLLEESDGTDVATVASGKKGAATCAADAVLTIKPMAYDGSTNGNAATQIFYTVNGKNPSLKGGYSNSGTYQTTDGKVNINNYIDLTSSSKQKLTIKAVCVTGIGVVSKVTSITITVNPASLYMLEIMDGPNGYLAAGTSWEFHAALKRKAASDFKIIKNAVWEITSGNEIASIGKTSGVLKTVKGQSGTVTVKCSYTEDDVTLSDSVSITVKDKAPVKSITLGEANSKMSYPNDSAKLGSVASQTVTVSAVADTDGSDVPKGGGLGFAWSSSNSDVVSVLYAGNGWSATLSAKAKGSVTISCMACDGSGKKASFKVTVYQLVTHIGISGQQYIPVGSSATYKTNNVYGRNAKGYKDTPNDKSVIWSLRANSTSADVTELGGVTIDPKKGTVKVSAAVSGGFYVVATANDGGGVYKTKRVYTTDAKASSVMITTTATDPAYAIKADKSGNLSSVQLYTVNATSSEVDEMRLTVTAALDNNTNPVWSSSNSSVAYIGSSGATATIVASRTGSATITCAANDGSGRKASFKVKVIVPVSNLMLTNQTVETYANAEGEASFSMLAYGKKSKTKLIVGDAYGKATNSKVTWEYEPVYVDFDNEIHAYIGTAMPEAAQEAVKKAKLFAGSKGSIKFAKNYEAALQKTGVRKLVGVLVKATTTDGTNITVSKLIVPTEPTKKVYFWNGYRKLTKATYSVSASEDGKVSYSTYLPLYADGGVVGFSVKSSNPEVATGFMSGDYLVISAGKRGKATLVITATDGSNKKAKLVLTVK